MQIDFPITLTQYIFYVNILVPKMLSYILQHQQEDHLL